MASGKPIVRQIAWVSILAPLVLMVVLIILFRLIVKPPNTAFALSLLIYLIIFFLLRFGIPRNHRNGVARYKAGNYESAIEEFKKSYEFFSRHSWVDKYRYITLLSSSRVSYTEMALVNIAFCYTQLGDGVLARQYYEKAQEQFPNSEMARTALNMIHSFDGQPQK